VNKSNYDKFPAIDVPASPSACVAGWKAVAQRLQCETQHGGTARLVLVIECYPGVDQEEIIDRLQEHLKPQLVVRAGDAMLPPEALEQLCQPFMGDGDPVFGFLSGLKLPSFFDSEKLQHLRAKVEAQRTGLVLVVGCGARLIHAGDVLVYADLARWEAQLRFRRNEANNLGLQNRTSPASQQYKRAFFIDWRVADRWKRPLISRWDFVLDTTKPGNPKLAEGEAVRRGLSLAVSRPFRVVPFFDPAPWGGHWMKEVCDLDRSQSNYGWCFDCVPEENSLLLNIGGETVELPSIDLVFAHPRALLGDQVHARFGDEFPIRFDLLDTMGGGNLSFQVHPLTEYIQHEFGMHYTQDESYYLLDAGPEAAVYLGLRNGVNPADLARDLQIAQKGEIPFPTDKYANRWPARAHDHFLIPAGTAHCSGADSMVLEISATPYIFTFKMWDWGRLGLDGKPRPIHLQHGLANIQWDRTTEWVRENLINRLEPLASGKDWREERTGLHAREFIETRRYWFSGLTHHHTNGSVNVLNLVKGSEAVVESPTGAFAPFVVHFAETFIVPAAVGAYTIRSINEEPAAVIKASVRF
jgi:mannose-6-phosphate isomerase class I